MSEPARTAPPPAPAADPIEDEVQEALAICGGDAIAALRATLIANAFLEAEVDRLAAAVSSGFARGKVRVFSGKVGTGFPQEAATTREPAPASNAVKKSKML